MLALPALFSFLFGVAFTGMGATSVSQARRRRAWPVARGSVTSGEVLDIGNHFVGVVRYVYALHQLPSAYRGGEHQMGRLESAPFTSRRQAEAHLARYPVGDRVEVRYDPARLTRSSLGPAAPAGLFARGLLFGGIAAIILSGVLLLTR